MGTTTRPIISEKNRYWIEKHRYYELKHFCLQYPIWKQAHAALDGFSKRPTDLSAVSQTNDISDPTLKCAEARSFYLERMDLIERIARDTDLSLSNYILEAVTEGVSYEHLKSRLEIPCCKDVYHELYRRFFWLLNKERQ
ncbi:hypothetical protein AGMMS49975_12340 [Clostridia bacterium]|nr:hypothetical protein AGMMS49975_12340 [Clostridia bacterium]